MSSRGSRSLRLEKPLLVAVSYSDLSAQTTSFIDVYMASSRLYVKLGHPKDEEELTLGPPIPLIVGLKDLMSRRTGMLAEYKCWSKCVGRWEEAI